MRTKIFDRKSYIYMNFFKQLNKGYTEKITNLCPSHSALPRILYRGTARSQNL